MQNTISIVVSKRPGVLAQIVSTLMREGCKLMRQAVAAADDPSRQRFTITVEGPEAALSNLSKVLSPFGSVEQRERGRPAAEGPAAGWMETAVQEILASFPDVAVRVRSLARGLPRESRAKTLSSLGERLGRREYARSYALGSPLKLEPALRRMVLPAFRQLARTELEGSSLRLAACPFCADAEAEGPCCDFLVGFARGLLDAAPATAGTVVRETRCRAAGDPFCELVFSVPRATLVPAAPETRT
jgi:predicted hydrocarbon binding protein